MNRELAEHVSLLAAPIFAGLLMPWIAQAGGEPVPAETVKMLRDYAIDQAQRLWLTTLDTESYSPAGDVEHAQGNADHGAGRQEDQAEPHG